MEACEHAMIRRMEWTLVEEWQFVALAVCSREMLNSRGEMGAPHVLIMCVLVWVSIV